jgi:hypothetical protein
MTLAGPRSQPKGDALVAEGDPVPSCALLSPQPRRSRSPMIALAMTDTSSRDIRDSDDGDSKSGSSSQLLLGTSGNLVLGSVI